MTRLLGGAAVAVPAIAALTGGAQKAKALGPGIYCGPNLFTATVFDPKTGVSGLVTFELVVNEFCCLQAITYTLTLNNKKAAAICGEVTFDGLIGVYLPVGTPAAIVPSCLCSGWTFEALLLQLELLGDCEITTAVLIPVNLGSKRGLLAGLLAPAPDSQQVFALTCSIM